MLLGLAITITCYEHGRSITVDALGSRDAIASLSDLTVDASASRTLLVGGDTVAGARLEFHLITGDPSTPRPDAVLRIQSNSFGDSMPIASLSRVSFDGSTSRGKDFRGYVFPQNGHLDDGHHAAWRPG